MYTDKHSRYGKIDGPLIELEFATISGVRVGFGYNYAIRMPKLNELTSFPLISDSGITGHGSDPGALLEAFRGGADPFVYVKKGSTWFAAGMTITALDLITLTAVLVIDIDSAGSGPSDTGVTIALFADGVFQMEPLAPADLTLFYIELVVKVEVNFALGFLNADAALAPASHVYVPMAHLTGQASYYTWFGNNPHAGEWVVSIGGYARTYKPCSYYPNPDRVGLNFTVGDNIHIIGEGYCAVTPKCAMAGGMLHLSLDVGPVSAYADLIFDAFINFKPFYFRAEMSISVGVECTIGKSFPLYLRLPYGSCTHTDLSFTHAGLGFCSIHIKTSIGADITVWGPHDFGGKAHVDFWFFSFNISFGAGEGSAPGIELDKFFEMVALPGPKSDPPTHDTVGSTGGTSTYHKYSVEDGLAPQKIPSADGNNFPSTGALKPWAVLAGTLQIRIDCGFALSSAVLKGETEDTKILLPSGKAAPDVHSWPMHCAEEENLTSTMTITIRKTVNDEIVPHFTAELVLKNAAKALWSFWRVDLDPLYNKPDSLNDPTDGNIDLVQAVRIFPPKPQCAQSKIIDFDASAAMKYTIPFQPTFPDHETEPETLEPVYFESEDDKGQPVGGPARWKDFKDMWLREDTPASSPEKAIRSSLVDLVADIHEWQIRPPEQMAKNQSAPTSLVTPVNAPRINKDGRTDWKLTPEPPAITIGLLGTYFPDLPFVC